MYPLFLFYVEELKGSINQIQTDTFFKSEEYSAIVFNYKYDLSLNNAIFYATDFFYTHI